MKVDNINTIVKNIESLPYKAILFDGKWGIGKTYAIDKALNGNDNVCKISLFELKNAEQIYHEALFQFTLKYNAIGEATNILLEYLSKHCKKANQIVEVMKGIIVEKDLFMFMSKRFSSLHIIVLDDLERINENLNIREVFGIVEELKKCNYVKVILIANTEEFRDETKEIFDKYNEKVIDKLYRVTEPPENVSWNDLKIHNGFITDFLMSHYVTNLRTLIKAQNYFDEIKLFCKNIENENFLNEIRLICYAVVIESIDGLYYSNPNKDAKNSKETTIEEINNQLSHRVKKYLSGIKSSDNLVLMIMRYYMDNIELTAEAIETEYKIYLQSGDKPNFFKSDEEIKLMLSELRLKMKNTKRIAELNEYADQYIIWSKIIDVENEDVILEYRELLCEILKTEILTGNEFILDYNSGSLNISSEEIQKIYNEENRKMKDFLVRNYIEKLKTEMNESTIVEYSYKLKDCFTSKSYCDIVKNYIDLLYDEKFFPIDVINNDKYYACYNIMYILYHSDIDRFLAFCDKLKGKYDKMSAYRLEHITQDIFKIY